jgi:hypothetical protein
MELERMTMQLTFYITAGLSAGRAYYTLDLMFDFVDYVSNRVGDIYYGINRMRGGIKSRSAEETFLVELVCLESIEGFFFKENIRVEMLGDK